MYQLPVCLEDQREGIEDVDSHFCHALSVRWHSSQSVLQCVAVCCSVLQCGAVWCSVLLSCQLAAFIATCVAV